MAGEAEAEAYVGEGGDRVLRDDEDVTVRAGIVRVSCPPEVGPVVVQLGMVW